MYRHILVGTDGSDTATDAVRRAATLAAAGGSRLTVLSVFAGVGSRGLSSPTRFILGNVPHAVSHHAPCDVAIIHTAD